MENEMRELEQRLKTFDDQVLHRSTRDAVREEKKSILRVLVHLREVERRGIFYVGICTSLFGYCVQELKYSEPESNRRISAMRLMRDMPELETKLKDGNLHMTGINQASTFIRHEERTAGPLTTEKKQEILHAIENQTKAQIERTLLGLSANPEEHVKKKESQRAITPELDRVQFVADPELKDAYEQLRGFLGYKVSQMGWSDVIRESFRIALDKLDPGRKKVRQKKAKPDSSVVPTPENVRAATAKPQAKPDSSVAPTPAQAPSVATAEPRFASAAQKRELYREAGSQCTYVDPKSGQRCPSRYLLQSDHIINYARGGKTELSNLRLLCAAHHRMETVRAFGTRKIELEIAARRSEKPANH
jgi:5-methylcytosine-specific restriction endonuclease McrA